MLTQVYTRVLEKEGVDVSKGVQDPKDRQFFLDAYEAISVLAQYDAPYYFQLTDFKQIESTGLQVARAPGKTLVYLGSLLLIVGVFTMFYLHYRRMWLFLHRTGSGTEIILAGSGNRNQLDFGHEFEAVQQLIRSRLQ
jgi:cytochrome c biogenesis protein